MSHYLKNIEKIINAKKFVSINNTIYNTRYINRIKINSNDVDGCMWFTSNKRDWGAGFYTARDEAIDFKLSDLKCYSMEDKQ
jgi:hypothetical protein